jgi:GNAT superfamily N-acetyltransferase
VDPALRRAGLGAAMYRRFFDEAIRRGAHTVRCVTGPRNRASLAFHRAMGFAADPSGTYVDGVPVQRDHAGPGLDRVTMSRALGENPVTFPRP